MQFVIKIICNRRITDNVKERAALLLNYLSIPSDLCFLPYWKYEECDIWEFDAKIDCPDYKTIKQYICDISRGENISVNCVADEWECAYFASFDELHSSKDTAFVECIIF